jgi:glycine cleavage system regulatory protein
MSAAFVLTVVSDDQPGIVEILSKVIADHEGNWTESSMMSLAGKFAGILLVHLPEQRASAFISTLDALETEGLQIVAQRSQVTPTVDTAREYSFDLVGQDRPGIVHDITEILAKHGVNVQELETTVQSASMSGESLFMAHARIFVPPEVDLEKLQDKLEELANELMVDIELEA